MSLFSSSGYYVPPPPWREHISGLYYNVTCNGLLQKTYLPQVELQAHATILATTSRTTLTQTFVNPSNERGIREVRYTFPLYDGVSVVGFACHFGDRTIVGEVKERGKARAVFREAVARNETAGLFEQLPEASDIFTTTVGNIPPGAKIIIKITYLGEPKHDMEVDGIRYTIPNVICPRYGNYPGDLRSTSVIDAMGSGISIVIDAEMADGSFIQKIQSPTHPISITMGTTTLAPNAEPTMTKASATLTLGAALLETDFVLQVIAKNTGVPKAVLENHPTIPNHRALMATLVPKFVLPPEKPELVFVCDRSGSMAGSRITLVIQALKVFLKSLPVGAKFNICSFGSSYSFLWPKSVTYSQQTLDEAIHHAEGFTANYGGTEMLTPLKATIDQRYKDIPLDVILLTDGEIWNQPALFAYLNQSVTESKAPVRLFTLGIGNGVSHALIEGVAKAGNGFSQTVGEGEKMDTKVVRMLKGALSPHIHDYTLEVIYSHKETTGEEGDDFEIVETVTDSLKVKLDLNEKSGAAETKKPISLFDNAADPDKEEPPAYDETGEERYVHLPKIPVPKIIQAPQNIPSLFAFNRMTAYLLLGQDAPKATPKSVLLRGTSAHGPLKLEIPISVLDQPGETIHQLAAKKAISELEQGRGWLPEARDEFDMLIKTKFEGRFDDLVEREAVRIGVQFQVGGKWSSFVAVESDQRSKEEKYKDSEDWEWLEDESQANAASLNNQAALRQQQLQHVGQAQQAAMMQARNSFASQATASKANAQLSGTIQSSRRSSRGLGSAVSTMFGSVLERGERLDSTSQRQDEVSSQAKSFYAQAKSKNSSGVFGGLFGSSSASPSTSATQASGVFKPTNSWFGGGGALFGGSSSRPSTFGSNSNVTLPQTFSPPAPASASRFGAAPPSGLPSPSFQTHGAAGQANHDSQDYQMQLMLLEQQNKKRLLLARQDQDSSISAPPPVPAVAAPASNTQALQDYQMGLMLLRQDNPKRLLMKRASQGDINPQTGTGFNGPPPATGYASAIPPPPPSYNAPPLAPGAKPALPVTESQVFGYGAPTAYHFTHPPIIPSVGFSSTPAAPITPSGNSAFSSTQSKLDNTNASFDLSFGSDESMLESFNYDSFIHADNKDAMDVSGDTFFTGVNSANAAPSTSFAPGNLFAGPTSPSLTASTFMTTKTPEDLTTYLISLQRFEGSWEVSPALMASLQIQGSAFTVECAKAGVDVIVFATALVITVFETKLKAFEGSWELVVEKAKGWLMDQGVSDVEGLVGKAGVLIK